MTKTELDSALLTPSQRKVLQGVDDITDRGRRSSRARARKRTRIALLEDIPLLFEKINPGELFDTHEIPDGSDRADDLNRVFRGTLSDSLRTAVAFVYRIADGSGLDTQRVIEQGIGMGEHGREEMLLERFRENPSEMQMGEIEVLITEGLITQEERNEALGLLSEFFPDVGGDDEASPSEE